MNDVFTIGFTKKDAEKFFDLINRNQIDIVIDVRLNNSSQLAGFSKYPDIKYFLDKICGVKYISDKMFSPNESTLKNYKSCDIDWNEYVQQFFKTLNERNINEYIIKKYKKMVEEFNICFLCSENEPSFCHRRLIAEKFAEIFHVKVIHLL